MSIAIMATLDTFEFTQFQLDEDGDDEEEEKVVQQNPEDFWNISQFDGKNQKRKSYEQRESVYWRSRIPTVRTKQ